MNSSAYPKLNRKLWVFLIVVSTTALVYFAIPALSDLLRFFSLKSQVQADTINFKVVETQNSVFQIEANYSYTINNQLFSHKEVLTSPAYDNPYQVKKSLLETDHESWKVYFNPKNPSQSSLQREISKKKLIDFSLSLGIFLYFLFLGDVQSQNFLKSLLKKPK